MNPKLYMLRQQASIDSKLTDLLDAYGKEVAKTCAEYCADIAEAVGKGVDDPTLNRLYEAVATSARVCEMRIREGFYLNSDQTNESIEKH